MATSGFGSTITMTGITAQVISIGMPSASVDVIDTTYMASASGWREKCAGLIDGGDLTVTARYDETNSNPPYSILGGTNVEGIIIQFPSPGGKLTFDGFVSGVSGTAPMDDKVDFEFTITVSGTVVFAVTV